MRSTCILLVTSSNTMRDPDNYSVDEKWLPPLSASESRWCAALVRKAAMASFRSTRALNMDHSQGSRTGPLADKRGLLM